jgi:hypothetical protein
VLGARPLRDGLRDGCCDGCRDRPPDGCRHGPWPTRCTASVTARARLFARPPSRLMHGFSRLMHGFSRRIRLGLRLGRLRPQLIMDLSARRRLRVIASCRDWLPRFAVQSWRVLPLAAESKCEQRPRLSRFPP